MSNWKSYHSDHWLIRMLVDEGSSVFVMYLGSGTGVHCFEVLEDRLQVINWVGI